MSKLSKNNSSGVRGPVVNVCIKTCTSGTYYVRWQTYKNVYIKPIRISLHSHYIKNIRDK